MYQKTRAKKTNIKNNETYKKVRSYNKDTYMHVHKLFNYMNKDNMDNEVDTTKNIIELVETTIDSHVEPSGNHLLNYLLEHMLNHLVKHLLNLLVNVLLKLILNPLLDQLFIFLHLIDI